MGYKRAHIRIPFEGSATLSNRHSGRIKAHTINISGGGVGLVNASPAPRDREYHVHLKTDSGKHIRLLATVAYTKDSQTGLKTVFIDKNNLQQIHDIVSQFQSSDDFMKYIDQLDILDDWFIDENGHKVDFDFVRQYR